MIKEKKCKNCKDYFKPRTSLQKYCTKFDCIKEFIREQKEREWKKRKAKMKTDLMTLKDYIIIAQKLFNEWIRVRDKGLNCISCDKPAKKENAGHFYNANNHWSVRFDEDNCHLQCEYCNTFLSANLTNYRINLIKKIGQERYDILSAKANETRKFTKEEVQEIINEYKKRLKK